MISSFEFYLAMQQPNDQHQFSFNKALDSSARGPTSKRSFPFKLLQLLEDASLEGNEHIVSWLPHGKAFKVHKTTEFENELIGRYFRQTKYRSFVRQLYHYRFARVDFGDDKGAYYHPDFQRHDKEKCLTVQRRSAEDQESHSSQMEQVSPSLMKLSALTPALNANDFKIVLGTGTQVTAIDANRIQNLGLFQQQFVKQQSAKLNPTNLPQKASATLKTNLQLPSNDTLLSTQLTTMQASQQGEPNWLGAWLERHYSAEQSQDSTDLDLEPRPLKDMGNQEGQS